MILVVLGSIVAILFLIGFAFGEDAARGTAQVLIILVIAAAAFVAYLISQGNH